MQEVAFIFKSFTKNQQLTDGLQASLGYKEFKEALIRIAIKGREILDQIHDAKTGAKSDTQADMANQAFDKMVENHSEKKEETETDANNQDSSENISQTTKNTLKGLFYYLDLPTEKQALNSKLKELKNHTPSIKERKMRKN